MRTMVSYVAWIIVGFALGFVLAQYNSDGMTISFLQKLPGCF